ncbi:hypothetical protein PS910_02208 [Pseudomonas fluorescens]|nr:hypothetical protein PS910_02208 [Pseudomonas fluorescens]
MTMKLLDAQVIRQALHWLEQGESVWLCTVLCTYGSAPRGPGAMLAALPDGQWRGSLSGGCVEEDFLERIGNGYFGGHNQVVRYGEGGLAPNLALPCGGVLDVLLEYIEPGEQARTHLEGVEGALNGDGLSQRRVTLESTARELQPANMSDPRVQVDASEVRIRVGAVNRLILAGWSPVAEQCASFALALGYEVVLCDPRPEVLADFSMPGVEVRTLLPALFIAEPGNCHASTAVVALTHDPRLDDLTLMEAVRTEAFYIGAMGSMRTSDKRRERLTRVGQLDPQALARVHAPIGLRLGSKTPAEIALAVMADILRVANGVSREEVIGA